MNKVINDIMTEPNGHTICPVRVLACAGFIFALVMCGHSVVVLKVAFDIAAFGQAYGVMLGALGVALGLKSYGKGDANVSMESKTD